MAARVGVARGMVRLEAQIHAVGTEKRQGALTAPPGYLRTGYTGGSAMKAQIYVTLKKTVLDPQGATIARALQGMGHPEIAGVRQGKFFEIDIAGGASKEALSAGLNRIAEDVLANPVIEEFRVEILD